MNVIDEIKSILRHEFGHLIVDVLLIEKHQDIRIEELLVRNYDCKNVSWCGWVQLEPKENLEYEEVVKDLSLTAFKFISLVSGCLFQSLGSEGSLQFNDCFAFKREAIGRGDYNCFRELELTIKHFYNVKNENRNNFNKNLEIILFVKYSKEISTLKDFLDEFEKIIDVESEKIYNDFLGKGSLDNYSFKLEGTHLKEVSNQLIVLMDKFVFADIVNEIHQDLIKILGKVISK